MTDTPWKSGVTGGWITGKQPDGALQSRVRLHERIGRLLDRAWERKGACEARASP